MSGNNGDENEKTLLPHHKQLSLCTTRLPYRQGRKLTAVKVYTINSESNHLLVFGVPSLNLRQETKSLFLHFGKLLQFYMSKVHPAEPFTETYHARFERIKSARIAKKMIDTKNFYGGILHVCYAPELESLEETRTKLLERRKDVTFRLKNIVKENEHEKEIISEQRNTETVSVISQEFEAIRNEVPDTEENEKLNMGDRNIIYLNKKRKSTIHEKFKQYGKRKKEVESKKAIEIVDCISTEKEVVSNINEALNYNKFGNEIVRKVEAKPLNRIVFHFNKNRNT